MSTQSSQPLSQSQSQPQSHTDFLVSITSESASLKVQIKQEYDNSCAIVHQINKSVRETDSCNRDLTKLRELSEVKTIELKILEADLETSRSSRERIQNNIDYLKKQEKGILIEENERLNKRARVAAIYENMIQNQHIINMTQPMVKRKKEIQNELDQNKIQLALLKREIEDWNLKRNQMLKIQRMKLNNVVLQFASVFSKKRADFKRKISLSQELDEKKVELQKLMETQKKQINVNTEETSIFQKPAPPRNISRNIGILQLPSTIKQSFHDIAGKLLDQRDLMKHFQQVTSFKTTHSPFILPSSLSRPFSPRNSFRHKLINRNLKSPSVERRINASPIGRLNIEKKKSFDGNKELSGKPLDTQIHNKDSVTVEPISEINLSNNEASSTALENITAQPDVDSSSIADDEVHTINSKNENSCLDNTTPSKIDTNGRTVILNNRAPSLCRSNCSTPVSVKSIGSQKERSVTPHLRNTALKSPNLLNSSRPSVHFNPITKIPQSPKISKRNISFVESGQLKQYRTPDILLKMLKGKQSSVDMKLSTICPKPTKRTKIDSTPGDVTKTKLHKADREELQSMIMSSGTRVFTRPFKENVLRNISPRNDATKIPLKEDQNLSAFHDEDNSSNEQSQSKYFRNSNNQQKTVEESCKENYQSNNEEENFYSANDVSKPNSNGSIGNGSHFSNITGLNSEDNFSASSPVSTFIMPFASSNEGGVFGFSNNGESNGFSLTGGSTTDEAGNNNGFIFNVNEDVGKQTFSLF